MTRRRLFKLLALLPLSGFVMQALAKSKKPERSNLTVVLATSLDRVAISMLERHLISLNTPVVVTEESWLSNDNLVSLRKQRQDKDAEAWILVRSTDEPAKPMVKGFPFVPMADRILLLKSFRWSDGLLSWRFLTVKDRDNRYATDWWSWPPNLPSGMKSSATEWVMNAPDRLY